VRKCESIGGSSCFKFKREGEKAPLPPRKRGRTEVRTFLLPSEVEKRKKKGETALFPSKKKKGGGQDEISTSLLEGGERGGRGPLFREEKGGGGRNCL